MFSWIKTLKKTATTLAAVAGAVQVTVATMPQVPDSDDSAAWQAYTVAVGLSVVRAAWNIWKTRDMPGNPFYGTALGG